MKLHIAFLSKCLTPNNACFVHGSLSFVGMTGEKQIQHAASKECLASPIKVLGNRMAISFCRSSNHLAR